MGDDAHSAHLKQTAALLPLRLVVAAGMVQPPLGGAEVLAPLVFQMDQRPLAAAKAEVLNAGEQQILRLVLHPFIRSQVTPSGRESSTVTV